jgi:hypothetical protein
LLANHEMQMQSAEAFVTAALAIVVVAVCSVLAYVASGNSPCKISYALIGAVIGFAAVPYMWAVVVMMQVERDVAAHNTMLEATTVSAAVKVSKPLPSLLTEPKPDRH